MKKSRILTLITACCLSLLTAQERFAVADTAKSDILLQLTVEDKKDVKSNVEGKLNFDVTLFNNSEDQIKIGVLDEALPFTIEIFNSEGEIVNQEILRIRSSNEFPKITSIFLNKKEKKIFNIEYPDQKNEIYKKLPNGYYSYSVIMPVLSLFRNELEVKLPNNFLLLKSNSVDAAIGDDVLKKTLAATNPLQATDTVLVGDSAPDFKVSDMKGKIRSLDTYKGKSNLLITFFPKCFTGGCANHLSSLRDHQKEFDAAQTQILAVSVDPADGEKGQLAFAKQWGFGFPFIPDTAHLMSEQFGAMKEGDERATRMTFLIDKQGVVRYVDTNVNVQTHGADMLAKIHDLGLDTK